MENITLKKELIEGKTITFDNDQDCIDRQHDDFREANLFFIKDHRNSWANGFKIEFNGALVHHTKTFPPFIRKLKELINTWNLERVKEVDEIEAKKQSLT